MSRGHFNNVIGEINGLLILIINYLSKMHIGKLWQSKTQIPQKIQVWIQH